MKEMRVTGVITIFVLLCLTVIIMAAFNEAPVSVEVPVGSEAVFRCQHSTANNIDWIVNGSFVGRSPPPDITLGIITEGDNPVDTLTIVARHDYNGTTIVCVAVFRDGSPDETSQPAAVLRVQAFIEIPVSQSVFVGETAMYRCRHSLTDTIEWMINGTTLTTDNTMPGISNGTMMESGNMVHFFSITGRDDNNDTKVVARADLPDGSHEDSTPIAILQVFVRFPTSLNVSSGSEAVFRCGNPNATGISWTINGTIVSNNPDFRQNNNGNDGSLTITARPQFNLHTIRCVALFMNENEISPPAVLQIQGLLDAVTSLTKVGSTLSWEAPFSLDLTNIDPDIVYCVDVYNITCGGRDLVSSDCHVTDTSYTAFSDGYLYEYIVTPRSNVEGAGNGTQSQWRDDLPTFSTLSTQLSLSTSASLRNYQIELTYSPALPIPSTYTLSLEALDGLDSLSRVETTATVEQPNQLLLDVSGLESRRLWMYTILAFECQEHSMLRGEILSTHDFQNISLSPFPGAVRVTGRYIEGSPATGVLVIVSGDSDSYYHIATRDGSDIQEATITGIAGGEYSVSVFVVEENGLPFERAATVPNRLSVERNNVERPSPSIDYSLESTSSGVCVKCTFLDTDTSECAAIVHSVSDLMNIESICTFTRSGDTASGCIEGVNLEDYQIGVIGFNGVSTCTSPARRTTIAVIIGPLLSFIVISAVVVVLLLVVFIRIWGKIKHRSGIKTAPPNTYEPGPPTLSVTAPLVHMVRSDGENYENVIEMGTSSGPPPPPSFTPPATRSTDVDEGSDVNEAKLVHGVVCDGGSGDTDIEMGTSSGPPPLYSTLYTLAATNVDAKGEMNGAVYSKLDTVAQAASMSVADDDQVNTSDIKHEEVNGDQYAVVNKPGKVPESSEATEGNKKPLIYTSLDVAPPAVTVPPASDRPVAYCTVQLEEANGDQYAEVGTPMVSGSTSVVDLVIENTKDLTVNVDGSGQVIEAVSSTPDVVPQAASISVADDDQVNNSDIKHEEVNGEQYAVVNKQRKVPESSDSTEGRKKPLVYTPIDVPSTVNAPPTSVDPVAYSEVQLKETNGDQYADVNKPMDDSTSVEETAKENKDTEGEYGRHCEIVIHTSAVKNTPRDDMHKTTYKYSMVSHDWRKLAEDKHQAVTSKSRGDQSLSGQTKHAFLSSTFFGTDTLSDLHEIQPRKWSLSPHRHGSTDSGYGGSPINVNEGEDTNSASPNIIGDGRQHSGTKSMFMTATPVQPQTTDLVEDARVHHALDGTAHVRPVNSHENTSQNFISDKQVVGTEADPVRIGDKELYQEGDDHLIPEMNHFRSDVDIHTCSSHQIVKDECVQGVQCEEDRMAYMESLSSSHSTSLNLSPSECVRLLRQRQNNCDSYQLWQHQAEKLNKLVSLKSRKRPQLTAVSKRRG